MAQKNNPESSKSGSIIEVQTSQFINEGTYRLFPVSKNEILVRFENLADIFDSQTSSKVLPSLQSINLEKFANDLFESVNRVKPDAFNVVEMDLQGVHTKGEKFLWRGAGIP